MMFEKTKTAIAVELINKIICDCPEPKPGSGTKVAEGGYGQL